MMWSKTFRQFKELCMEAHFVGFDGCNRKVLYKYNGLEGMEGGCGLGFTLYHKISVIQLPNLGEEWQRKEIRFCK